MLSSLWKHSPHRTCFWGQRKCSFLSENCQPSTNEAGFFPRIFVCYFSESSLRSWNLSQEKSFHLYAGSFSKSSLTPMGHINSCLKCRIRVMQQLGNCDTLGECVHAEIPRNPAGTSRSDTTRHSFSPQGNKTFKAKLCPLWWFWREKAALQQSFEWLGRKDVAFEFTFILNDLSQKLNILFPSNTAPGII